MTRLGDYISEFSVKNHLDESIPVYSVTNDRGFCSGYFNKDVASKDKTTYKIVPRGYFAYNPSRINVGSIAWQNSAERVIVSPLYVVFKVSDKLDRQYLLHYLKSDVGMTFIKAHAAGSVRDSLKFSDLKELPIHVVPLEKQRKIARTLDKLDALISQCHQQANSFDTLVKSQFVEMFGDPEINPCNWPVVPLANVISKANNGMARRGNDTDGEIVLRLIELQDGYIDYTTPNRIILNDMEKRRYLLKDKDFLFARVNGNPKNVGRCAVFHDIGEPVYHNDHIIRVRFDDDSLDGIFASVLLNSAYGKRQIRGQIKTSAGQYTISQDGIGAILAITPPLALQTRFAAFVAQVDKSKFSCRRAGKVANFALKCIMEDVYGVMDG